MKSKSFDTIEIVNEKTIKTGNELFDNWFSRDGGIVPGSIIFVTGNSGAGKTTLMFNLMNWLKNHKSSFYSREMVLSSVKQQVKGLEFDNKNASFVDETDCPHIDDYLKELDQLKPDFVIVDSLQAIAAQDYPEIGLDKASVMVRQMLEKWCKANNATLFLIGHNTKDNDFAGKNTNMQMVDAHMVLEFDKTTGIRRIYWGQKNRKGPMGQLFYSIEGGKINFYNENEEFNFMTDFQEFVKNYIKKFDKNCPNVKGFKKEVDGMSTEVFEKHNENEYQYMMEYLPRFYKILHRFNLD